MYDLRSTIARKIVNRKSYIVNSLRPRRTMDSIRVSEAPDTGSIPVEATKYPYKTIKQRLCSLPQNH